MKILAVSGSLRSSSANTAILRALRQLAPDDMLIWIYDRLGNLPHFNPEIDGDDVLTLVRDWRTQLQSTDGVIFCTPEYAHGVPGVLKNALDWIVSSGEFVNKPTAAIAASPSIDGGSIASASLIQTLKVMMAAITEETTLCIPAVTAKLSAQGKITDPATERALRSLIYTLGRLIDFNLTYKQG